MASGLLLHLLLLSSVAVVAWWHSGLDIGLATPKVAGLTPGSWACGKQPWASCSHACASVTSSIFWCRSRGGDALRLGR